MLNERAPVFYLTEDATIYPAAQTVLNGLARVEVFGKITLQNTGRKIPDLVAESTVNFIDDINPVADDRLKTMLPHPPQGVLRATLTPKNGPSQCARRARKYRRISAPSCF